MRDANLGAHSSLHSLLQAASRAGRLGMVVAAAVTMLASVPSVGAEGRAKAKAALGPQGPNILIGSKPRGKRPPKPPTRSTLRVVIDTPYQIFRNQGSYVHVVAWHPSGAPARGASVFAGAIEVGRTDSHGTLVFVYPPKGSSTKSAIGINRITVVAGSKRGQVRFNPNLRTASFANDQLFVYTDRGVYRPGETVRVRSIAWHLAQDYTPVAGEPIEITLKDARGRVVGGGKSKTSEFGIAALDIPLAGTLAEGLYELQVAYKRGRETTRLQIREFKPPAITIEHDLARFITADQKKLAFKLTLKPATGGRIRSARVVLSVRAAGAETLHLERQVKGPGPHKFELDTAALDAIRAKLRESQFATVELSVRDHRGRTATLRRELRYSSNPYIAVLEADKDQYTTGERIKLVAKVSDLDGVPLRGKRLQLRYNGQLHSAVSSDKGMALFSLKMAKKAGTAELLIDGVKKPISRAILRWIKSKAMSSHIATPIIRENDSARVRVVFPSHIRPAEKVVHMDVTDTSGAIVNAVLLPITKTRDGYVAEGSFRAPTWGSMLLTFFALGRDTREPRKRYQLGLLAEGQNLVVHPNRELTITLDGVPDKSKPGDRVNLGIKVTDPNGKLVDAEIGVMGVDRRVLSLKDPLEVTPMDQLYDPKLRTMSTTGSKILSWPVVSRNWGTRQNDVALPPFNYLAGGPLKKHRLQRKTASKVAKNKPTSTSGKTKDDDDNNDGDKLADEESGFSTITGGSYGTIGHGSGTGSGYGAGKGGAKLAKESNRGRRAQPSSKPRAQITIRTKFPETFLWRPHLLAKNGHARLRAELPHALGQQELVLVASDKHGGVGILRQRITVDQPVFVEADFPEVLRHGETVEVPVLVHNKTAKALKAKLTLRLGSSPATTLHKTVAVPAKDVGVAVFSVRAERAGSLSFRLDADTSGFRDVLSHRARVAPGGAPHAVVTTGVSKRGAAFKADFTLPADGAGSASLSIAFPAVTSAFLGADSLGRLLSQDPLALASDLHSASLVLAYAKKNKLRSSQLERLQGMVLRAVAGIEAAQADDGSFSFWRNRVASPYVTAWVLEGLVGARKTGAKVSDKTIRNATAWLANQFKNRRVTISDISWWEGDSTKVRLGLTAEVFDVLTQVPNHLQPPGAKRLVSNLATELKDYLANTPELDPLAAGRAIQGLSRLGQLDIKAARAALGQLTLRRNLGHWEPSWFHAYGGNVEATVAMLAAMQLIDPTGFQTEKRDALGWILSTRDAWGQWHNERGTAQAIRALLMVGAAPEEVPGTVTVLIDGRIAKTLKVDPADPFLSAIALNQIDLGAGLRPGAHSVEVRYDGKLAPATTLAVRRWQYAKSPTAKLKLQAGDVRLWSTAVPSLAVDAAADVRVDISRPAGSAASVLVPPSNLVRVDLQRLAAAIELNPSIVRYRIVPEGVRLDLTPGMKSTAVIIPYVGLRRGTGAWPTVGVTIAGKTLRVSPGALRVQ